MVLGGFLVVPLHSQGIRDSLFLIDAVEIMADRIFLKEEAGMKQTEIDTSILQGKVNLSLSDVLSENSSVFIKNHGRGALSTASFRGTAASHTSISWNGINIQSPMLGMVDFSLIPVYVIDELKLKHGAASIADQAGGIGGSISINNPAVWKRGTEVQYMQGIGSYRTFDEYFMAGFGNGKIRVKTRLYHNFSRNDYTFINRGIGNLDPVTGDVVNPVDTNDNAAYLRYGVLQEFHYRPHSGHVLSLLYWGQYADRTIPRPTSYEGPDNSNLNNQADTDHKVVAHWKYYAPFGKIMVRSGYSGKQLDYVQKNRIPGLGLVPSIHSISQQNSFLNTLSYTWDPGKDLSVEGKVDLNHHDVNSRDTISGTGYDRGRNEVSLFGSLRKSFGDRLNMNLIIRQEWVDGQRIPFIPFLGLDFRIVENSDLVLKASLVRNYHMPALNDLYWQPGGNPDLLPEQGYSLEAGLEYQKVFNAHKIKAEATFYRTEINNWILWIPSYKGYWEPMNIKEVLSTGMESELQLNGSLGIIEYRLSGTYAYTRSVNHSDPLARGDASRDKQLVYIPLHSGNLMTSISYRNFFVSYQYNAYSERYTTSSNDPSRRDWLYPYFMNDVAAGGEFRIRKTAFSAEFRIYNLFNESYHSVLYRPMPGRNYHLVVKIGI